MEDMVIRQLKREDTESLVEIAVAAWEPIYAYYRQAMGDELFAAACPDWRENKAGQIRRACAIESTAMVLVAEVLGQIVGFVTFYADHASHIGEIGNNAVHPDVQGKGIGPAMYQSVFEQLRELGMRYVRVRTGGDPAHAPARRAYEKSGFSLQLPAVEYYRRL
jgi:GNAT superfamily N-acetyltransferase